jgi:K+-sensing histidine kinase KdpD
MRFVNTWSGRWPARYLIATLTVALPIAVLEKLRPDLSQTSIALILVLPVILVAVTQGRGPALYASILVGMSFNFFFIGPYYSFLITRPEDVVAFIVFVTTAVLVGQLSSRLEKRVLLTETKKSWCMFAENLSKPLPKPLRPTPCAKANSSKRPFWMRSRTTCVRLLPRSRPPSPRSALSRSRLKFSASSLK